MSAADVGGVLDAWRGLRGAEASEAILATVAHVQGSAYRRPGARMLIRTDGSRVGSISGGCLDGDVVRRAWWATEGDRPALRVYDMTADEDAVWQFGLGCNGVVHVLLERVGWPAPRASLEFLDARRADRRPAAMATVVAADDDGGGPSLGDRLMLLQGGEHSGGLADSPHAPAIVQASAAALRDGTNRLLHLEGCAVLLEVLRPGIALVVLGGGHDAVPLVALARGLGWHVTVADRRPAFARPERFPAADRVVRLPDVAPLDGIRFDSRTAVVVMTHDVAQDASLLRALRPRRPRYVGLLGPAARARRLLAEIGGAMPDLHAPVGLDIGAETPQEIALAIVAEIRAALAERAGGELRRRGTPIHDAVEEVGAPLAARPAVRESAVCGLSSSHA